MEPSIGFPDDRTDMIRLKKIFLPAAAMVLFLISCKGKSENPIVDPKPDNERPVTPFKTLNYLYEISGKKTIAGIHNREPSSSPARWTNEMESVTGKIPGLWSGDFLFQADNIENRSIMINEAINQWKKGAMVNLMWHACSPIYEEPCEWDNGKGVMSSMTDEQWNQLITDGTQINSNWKARMDKIAVHLQVLEDNGVEVLFRPLHEMNQGKFWWGGRPGPNGTAKLWQITHDYMTKTKGLSNLIWVWDMQDFGSLQSDLTTYNPGENYWDVLALDVYDGSGYTTAKYTAVLAAAKGKPIALGECEKLPTAAQLASQPKSSFFMGWSELVFKNENNTPAQLNALMKAANVITLDEMPGWQK